MNRAARSCDLSCVPRSPRSSSDLAGAGPLVGVRNNREKPWWVVSFLPRDGKSRVYGRGSHSRWGVAALAAEILLQECGAAASVAVHSINSTVVMTRLAHIGIQI
ncbi:hypothetical protein M1D80_11030 [Phyllobacteriaceae bacterium JZ32]